MPVVLRRTYRALTVRKLHGTIEGRFLQSLVRRLPWIEPTPPCVTRLASRLVSLLGTCPSREIARSLDEAGGIETREDRINDAREVSLGTGSAGTTCSGVPTIATRWNHPMPGFGVLRRRFRCAACVIPLRAWRSLDGEVDPRGTI